MSFNIKSILINVIAALIFLPAVSSAEVNVNGKSTQDFDPGVFSSKPSGKFRKNAILDAKLAAWERYTQRFSPSKMKSYRQIESSIIKDIDEYIIETNVIDEEINKSDKRYTVAVRATINTAKLDAKLSEISNAGSSSSGSGSNFTFIFVAREESSIKSFDAKRTKIEMNEGSGYENETATQQDDSLLGSHENKAISKTTTGGSVTRKADQVDYQILSAGAIDAAMGDVLTASGFEVVDYGDVVSACGGTEPQDVRQEFTKSNEISRVARRDAIKGSRDCDVSYFAVGTLDVGMSEIDPVTGNERVYVSVTAQEWNIDKRLPKKIASVGPVQYQGLGPNVKVAQTNALKQSAKNAANEIVNQLNAKGLY